MENTTALYWLTRLDGIKSGLTFLIILLGLMLVILLIGRLVSGLEEEEDWVKAINRWLKVVIPSIISVGILQILIPTRNEAILIYAGGKTMDYVQADTSLQKIPQATTNLILKYIEEKTEEIQEK